MTLLFLQRTVCCIFLLVLLWFVPSFILLVFSLCLVAVFLFNLVRLGRNQLKLALLASLLTEWFCFLYVSAPHSGSSMMNMFWSFFVSSLTKEGIPEYVLRVYRSKFFQLPWQSFIPTLHNMQLMQEVCCFFSENLRLLPFKK